MARVSKGITQFYLSPTHEPYLPLLPSRRASPPFGWYSLHLSTELYLPVLMYRSHVVLYECILWLVKISNWFKNRRQRQKPPDSELEALTCVKLATTSAHDTQSSHLTPPSAGPWTTDYKQWVTVVVVFIQAQVTRGSFPIFMHVNSVYRVKEEKKMGASQFKCLV